MSSRLTSEFTMYTAKDGLELLDHLLSQQVHRDYKCAPPNPVFRIRFHYLWWYWGGLANVLTHGRQVFCHLAVIPATVFVLVLV